MSINFLVLFQVCYVFLSCSSIFFMSNIFFTKMYFQIIIVKLSNWTRLCNWTIFRLTNLRTKKKSCLHFHWMNNRIRSSVPNFVPNLNIWNWPFPLFFKNNLIRIFIIINSFLLSFSYKKTMTKTNYYYQWLKLMIVNCFFFYFVCLFISSFYFLSLTAKFSLFFWMNEYFNKIKTIEILK